MEALTELDERQIDTLARAASGDPGNVQEVYPLSPLQEGLLFHHLLNERHDTYLLSTLLELRSRAHLERFIEALQHVIRRHESLRSAVVWQGMRQPVQVVWRQATLRVDEIGLDPHRDALGELKERMRPGHRELNLSVAPLVWLCVAAAPHGNRWYALLQLHHMICDHQSWDCVIAEALTLLAGEQELPAPAGYRSYRAWARGHDRPARAEAFFRERLAGANVGAQPFGLSDVHGDGTEVEEARDVIEPELARRIRTQARRRGVSAARLFHVAWSLVVSGASGSDDVVFGTVVAAAYRRKVRAQRTVGLLVNTLPMRVELAGRTVAELVEHVEQQLAQLLIHDEARLASLQNASGRLGGTPLFTAVLNYRYSVGHSVVDPDPAAFAVTGARVVAHSFRTNYPLCLVVDHLADRYALTAQAQRPLDPERVLGYARAAIESVTTALEAAPQTRALSLRILPKSEWHQVTESFNATCAAFSRRRLVHQLIEDQVGRSPDSVAVVYEDATLTYAELNRRANQLARYLRGEGVGADQRVGVYVERSLEMVVGLLGVVKAGGAYVPLDPGYPVERLASMLEDAAPGIVLTQDRLRAGLPRSMARVVTLDREWDEIARHQMRDLDSGALDVRPDHLAYVIYTSGSTGKPKGAMNEHGAVVNRLLWMQAQYGLSERDRVLQKTPFSFDVSVWELFLPLMSGASLVVARPRGHQDPSYLRELIEETSVTLVHFVPSMLQAFLEQHRPGRCASVRHVVCSGEELSPALQNRCLEQWPRARLWNLYGPTECAVDVTAWECEWDEGGRRVPIGRPIANTRLYILDRRLRPVALEVTGEIYIAGAPVGRGYLNRPALTAERFVADPFSSGPEGRMYRTGDLGRWRTDGVIEFLGRNDHQVKIRGLRIELGEIEAQLRNHRQVREVVVTAREDDRGEKRLVAYVVPERPAEGEAPPASNLGERLVPQLRGQLRAALPDYMVPSSWMVLDALPLTPSGKVDRRALPEPQPGDCGQAYEPPVGEIEGAIAALWEEVLRVERVGRTDNFFELGGHSLLGMRLIARIGEALRIAPPLASIFRHPTVRDMAALVASLLARNIGPSLADDPQRESGVI